MNTSPKITVIIPVYHDEQFLKDCINSIKKSAIYAKIKLEIIIVVDDPEFNKVSFQFPKGVSILFNSKNLGFGKSVNKGARKAKGEWLLIANVDTITNKSTIKTLTKNINDRTIGIVGPKIISPDGSLEHSILDEPSVWNIFKEHSYLYKLFPLFFHSSQVDNSMYSYSHTVEIVTGAYFLIRKDIFHQVHGFDELFYLQFEDFDLCRRVRKLGYIIYFNSDAQIIHFGTQSSGGVKVGNHFVISLIKYLNKWNSNTFIIVTALIIVFIGSLLRLSYWMIFKYTDGSNRDNTNIKIQSNKLITSTIINIVINRIMKIIDSSKEYKIKKGIDKKIYNCTS